MKLLCKLLFLEWILLKRDNFGGYWLAFNLTQGYKNEALSEDRTCYTVWLFCQPFTPWQVVPWHEDISGKSLVSFGISNLSFKFGSVLQVFNSN